jgi:hypothetical protein
MIKLERFIKDATINIHLRLTKREDFFLKQHEMVSEKLIIFARSV